MEADPVADCAACGAAHTLAPAPAGPPATFSPGALPQAPCPGNASPAKLPLAPSSQGMMAGRGAQGGPGLPPVVPPRVTEGRETTPDRRLPCKLRTSSSHGSVEGVGKKVAGPDCSNAVGRQDQDLDSPRDVDMMQVDQDVGGATPPFRRTPVRQGE